MSNGARELRNRLLGGQLPKSFQLLNDSYDERDRFRNIILSTSVQVVVVTPRVGNYFLLFTYVILFLYRGLQVKGVCGGRRGGEGFLCELKILRISNNVLSNKLNIVIVTNEITNKVNFDSINNPSQSITKRYVHKLTRFVFQLLL